MTLIHRITNLHGISLAVLAVLTLSPLSVCHANFFIRETDQEVTIGFYGLAPNEPDLLRRRAPAVLVSPSGDRFDTESVIEKNFGYSLLASFGSINQALDYLSGTWQVTLSPFPDGYPPAGFPQPTRDTIEVQFDPISPDSFVRDAPTLVSPAPGTVIRNGSDFRLDWEYSPEGEPLGSLFQVVPHYVLPPGATHYQRSEFSSGRPSADSDFLVTESGSSSGYSYNASYRHVIGREGWVFDASIEVSGAWAPLPFDIDFLISSNVDLNEHVTTGPTDGLGIGVREPVFGLTYNRVTGPIPMVLSAVPEPASIGILALTAGGWLTRRRVRTS